jgi:hypothetical protein
MQSPAKKKAHKHQASDAQNNASAQSSQDSTNSPQQSAPDSTNSAAPAPAQQ